MMWIDDPGPLRPPVPYHLRQAHGVFPQGRVLYPWLGGASELPDQPAPEPWMGNLVLATEDPAGLGLPNYWIPRRLLVPERVEPVRSCTTCRHLTRTTAVTGCGGCHPVRLTMWEAQ